MSRVGKKPILIPGGVEAKIENKTVTIKGPKGELSRKIRPEINIEIKEGKIIISLEPSFEASLKTKEINSLWGLTRALVANMVKGVADGFEKKLEIQGVGYKAAVEGENLVLSVGFTNPVTIAIPKTLKIKIEKNIIIVSGFDIELVNQFAANIRKVREPEPYKGKGIRYVGEVVRRKLGKKVVTTTG